MQRGGRVLMYPPIHEEIDEWGLVDLVYRVVFRDGRSEVIGFVDPLPREEAHQQVREILQRGLRNGRYQESQFYPQDPNDIYVDVLQFPQHYDGLGEDPDAAHGHGCIGGVPASGEAILGLRETSMDEGECSVCLMEFEAGSEVRLMPCSHWFHEHCIFSWLQISHVCPLCRFALPT